MKQLIKIKSIKIKLDKGDIIYFKNIKLKILKSITSK